MMKTSFRLLLIAALGRLACSQTVVLDYGTFVGQTNTTTNITSFLGVRYADPPLGDLRWRPPVTPPSSNLGVVNASAFGPSCIATITPGAIPSSQSEDCLYANVYTPASASGPLPVLVYFHGGGFQGGDSRGNTPTYMLPSSSTPFVFVTFEYRLGAFGFLNGKEVGADGTYNVGMLDQRAGLRWIQRYISNFGGDPSQVTIWGQSAGAGATMLHLIANGGDSKGLFQRVMGDSPSLSYMPRADSAYDQSIFNDFVSLAGCSDASNIMDCLRNATSRTLANAENGVAMLRTTTLFVFAPRVDDIFFREHPVEAFTSGRFSRVPIFFGGNTNEGASWASDLSGDANTSLDNATEVTVYNFLRGQYGSLTNESFNRALELYPLEGYGTYDLQGQQMYGEARYICSAVLITQNAAKFGLPSFHYHYNNAHLGSGHGSELAALYNAPSSNANANDTALFENMRQYWTSFATSGRPVASNALSWRAVSMLDGSLRMRLDPSVMTMERVPSEQTARCDFWHSLSQEIST
ncbi:Carboxylesterase [Hymenopellis radicata]|nr:Carboxylesterase [Hymenopellis radicata]